jgi:hypothetical protein
MDADERLRFTIVITRQSIYWSGRQMAKALSMLDPHARHVAAGPADHYRQLTCRLCHSWQLGCCLWHSWQPSYRLYITDKDFIKYMWLLYILINMLACYVYFKKSFPFNSNCVTHESMEAEQNMRSDTVCTWQIWRHHDSSRFFVKRLSPPENQLVADLSNQHSFSNNCITLSPRFCNKNVDSPQKKFENVEPKVSWVNFVIKKL